MGQLGIHFGQQLKLLREGRSLTQAGLAELAGTSEEWVRRLERGAKAPSFETIEALSRALEVSPARLFAGAGDGRHLERLSMMTESMSPEELDWLEATVQLLLKRPKRQ